MGTHIYSQEGANETELVLNIREFLAGRLHITLGMRALAHEVSNKFQSDEEAISALAGAINYIKTEFELLLPRVRHELNNRYFHRIAKKRPKADDSHLDFLQESLDENKRGLKSFESKSRNRLTATRGGNQRTQRDWLSENALKQYAQLVDDRRLLADQMKHVFNECLEAHGWIPDLRQDRNFQLLSQDVSPEIIDWAIRQVASKHLPSKLREPQAIACEMARQELKLSKPEDIGTLQGYYRRGKELIKRERSKTNQ